MIEFMEVNVNPKKEKQGIAQQEHWKLLCESRR